MTDILAFNRQETKVIGILRESLQDREFTNELTEVIHAETAIKNLASTISLYPSILGNQHLGKSTRSVDTLIENLCVRDVIDFLLRIPTKAILGKTFIVAKINFFLMQNYVTQEILRMDDLQDSVHDIVENNVIILMAEEVFLAIIADRGIELPIRSGAAYILAEIWEKRMTRGVENFVPVLQNIWKTRDRMIPSYGTMMGISELFSMANRVSGKLWLDYLTRDEITDDELDALLEFLMGISYEELGRVRHVMEERHTHALSVELINEILGEQRVYPRYTREDPRELFRSFRHRKDNARFRARASLPGPKKTLEEYIMCYMLSLPREGKFHLTPPG